jgi:rsbT antagonist protein RsbS
MKIPILKIKNILLTSIPEDLTDEDAIDFQSDVLNRVNKTEAKGIIIDITALQVVDSFMAKVINETASMVRLLGANVILSGMNPAVALTLVEMGRELINVETALNLDHGLEIMNRLITDAN